MRASYHITQPGLLYAIASGLADEERRFLLAFLRNNSDSPFSFSDVQAFYNQDTEAAFRQICALLEQGFIDIDENISRLPVTPENTDLSPQPVFSLDGDYLLSDLNGLPINYTGFERQQAEQLAAVACDYIRVSRRTWQNYESGKSLSPISIDIRFHEKEVSILFLHMGNFNCLLSVTDPTNQHHARLFSLIHYLCNRYNYERS